MRMLSDKHETVTGYDFTIDKPLIRSRAIRQKCRECTNNQEAEIRRCQITDCPLWPWRMGRRLRAGEETLHRAKLEDDTEILDDDTPISPNALPAL